VFAAGLIIASFGAAAQSPTPAGIWTQKAPMPAVRGEVAAAAVDNKLFALGGGAGGKAVPRNEEYDPASDRWRERAPLPQARDHLAVVAVDGRIHVIGGRLAGAAERTGQHDVYDPTTNSWSSAAPLPTPRSGVAVALYKGMILVLGGELPPDHTFPENEAYDVLRDRWV